MSEHKDLPCYVVRDLLPSYIEELTEAETTLLVQKHLSNCPSCRKIEQDMRQNVTVKRSPKRELKFLRNIRRTRLLAALLSLFFALWWIFQIYSSVFCYSNTEAGRFAAVEEQIFEVLESTDTDPTAEETSVHVAAWEKKGRHLFIYYTSDTQDGLQGVCHLERGLNGKYRYSDNYYTSSACIGGIYAAILEPKGTDLELLALAGYNCREFYRAEVELCTYDIVSEEDIYATKSFDLSGGNFLTLIDFDELKEEFGWSDSDVIGLEVNGVTLYDKEGKDVTSQYMSKTLELDGDVVIAVDFFNYVDIGIIALVGFLLARHFLRKNKHR